MPDTSTNPANKSAKAYKKARAEHYKDIVIAILVTAIVAFGLGVKVQAGRNSEVTQAVTQATQTAQVKK